ncbi:MAG: DUF2878 domain-containing protein [Candidatus Methylumidiphilus sp.]
MTISPKTLARSPLSNFLAYQFAWFACILSAAGNLPWIGSFIALIIVIWHVSMARLPMTELALIVVSGVIGLSWESVMVQTGWITYPSGNLISGFAPHWIVALWLVFATTFNVSLKWFKTHLAVVALFGFVGGPLAFYAGSLLGALTLTPKLGLIAIAIGWGLLMPILMLIARRLDGINPPTEDYINP